MYSRTSGCGSSKVGLSMLRVAISCFFLVVSMAVRGSEPLSESECAFMVAAPEGGFKIVPSKTLRAFGRAYQPVLSLSLQTHRRMLQVSCVPGHRPFRR